MALTYSQLKTNALNKLQDSGTVNFTSAEMDTFIADACRETGQYVPHIVKVSFYIESRTGTATSTSANNLVDTTESQFLATDVGKDVYDVTTKTWTQITAYTSASQVALSDNVFTSGDQYKIFNQGCSDFNQINISTIDDYQNIESVEYPIGRKRNWTLEGTILTILVDWVPSSKVQASGTQPDIEVVVRFKKRHLVSQLTDLAGVIAASASAAATAISLSSLQTSGTIETGQEFTIANIRGTYTITSDATIAANTVLISIYPGLESAIAGTGSVVTLNLSTLTPTLEPIVSELAAGLAAQSKPMDLYQHSYDAVTAVGLTTAAITSVAGLINAATTDAASARVALLASTVAIAAIAARLASATTYIASGTTYNAAGTVAIAAATTEIAKIVTEVQLAASALASGTVLINTIPVGGGAGEWMGEASGNINVAHGRIANGQSWLQQAASELTVANNYFTASGLELRGGSEKAQEANVNHANAAQYLATAGVELREAAEKISEGNASLQKAGMEIRIVDSGRNMEAWGRTQLASARARLRGFCGYPHSTRYGRD